MHLLVCSARRLAGGLTPGRRPSHLPALRHLIPLAGTAGLMILVSACASEPGHQASAIRARPRHTTVVAAARPPAPTPAASRPAATAPSGTGPTGSTGSTSSSAATHPQSEQLATATLGSFQVVLTKVRDTEPGETSQAEVLARGYVNGNLLATRQIGDGYGWNWFASGVCSLTITTGTGPPPVHVVRQITVVMMYDPGIGCVSTITKSWPAQLTSASQPAPVTAYVSNGRSGTVTPINTVTNKAGKAITVPGPGEIAVTPNGRTAYVFSASNTVTPITTATNKAGKAITVDSPVAIAITPNGRTAYVANAGSDTVTPIATATNTAGKAIFVGGGPVNIAITPNGTTAYVCTGNNAARQGTVTPISTASNKPVVRVIDL